MQRRSRPTTLADFGWWVALSVILLLLYLFCQHLGFSVSDSKGISVVALLIIITFGLVAQRAWIKSRGNRRFEGLSLEQTSLELDKVFEEQVAAGTITRADLEEVRAKAKAEFERERLSGRIDDGSV